MLSKDHKIHDHDLDDGPVEDRGCTDSICCIVFLLFWIGTFAVLGIALKEGDYTKILRPYDGSKAINRLKNAKKLPVA